MKKFLLLFVMGFSITLFANAQVIELIGMGVYENNPSTLIVPDPGSVEKVVVVAAATFLNSTPSEVTFSGISGAQTVSFIEIPAALMLTPNNVLPAVYGYYTATFTNVDGTGITLENYGQQESIKSFTAYIYRNGPSSGIYSSVTGDHAFFWLNGSGNPLVYTFTIPFSFDPRDVAVSLPFTDLESNDTRPANVIVTAGAQTMGCEFDLNNAGDLLHLETITVPDVPGDVTEVTVTIFSKTRDEANNGGLGGDSFITGPVLLTTTFNQGCALTQGYWKTHSKYGPASKPDPTWNLLSDGPDTEFFLSGQTYLEVLWTAPNKSKYYILAHQYIAAELNILAGAYAGDIQPTLDAAKVLLETYTPGQVSKSLKNYFTSLGGILDDYNNGKLGPVHCSEIEENMDKSAELINSAEVISDFVVYPNPIKGKATVSFSPVSDGIATVDLYNLMGQKQVNLYSQSVNKNLPVTFTFDANRFNEGMYLIVLQNGSTRLNTKIVIGR